MLDPEFAKDLSQLRKFQNPICQIALEKLIARHMKRHAKDVMNQRRKFPSMKSEFSGLAKPNYAKRENEIGHKVMNIFREKKKNDTLTSLDVAEMLGIKRDRAARTLSRLSAAGKIVRVGFDKHSALWDIAR